MSIRQKYLINLIYKLLHSWLILIYIYARIVFRPERQEMNKIKLGGLFSLAKKNTPWRTVWAFCDSIISPKKRYLNAMTKLYLVNYVGLKQQKQTTWNGGKLPSDKLVITEKSHFSVPDLFNPIISVFLISTFSQQTSNVRSRSRPKTLNVTPVTLWFNKLNVRQIKLIKCIHT